MKHTVCFLCDYSQIPDPAPPRTAMAAVGRPREWLQLKEDWAFGGPVSQGHSEEEMPHRSSGPRFWTFRNFLLSHCTERFVVIVSLLVTKKITKQLVILPSLFHFLSSCFPFSDLVGGSDPSFVYIWEPSSSYFSLIQIPLSAKKPAP